MKFAYQDMSKQREVEEAKLKQSNPKKAEQMERLGMGFGNRRSVGERNGSSLNICFRFSGVSHSAMTDMQTIQQEGVTSTRNVSLATRTRDFFDEFDSAGFSSRSKYVVRRSIRSDGTHFHLVTMIVLQAEAEILTMTIRTSIYPMMHM